MDNKPKAQWYTGTHILSGAHNTGKSTQEIHRRNSPQPYNGGSIWIYVRGAIRSIQPNFLWVSYEFDSTSLATPNLLERNFKKSRLFWVELFRILRRVFLALGKLWILRVRWQPEKGNGKRLFLSFKINLLYAISFEFARGYDNSCTGVDCTYFLEL